MKHQLTLVLILIPALISLGCGTRTTTRQAKTDDFSSNQQESWFCQVGATDDEWQCVQNEALATTHKPKRLPPSRGKIPRPAEQAALPNSGASAPAGIKPAPLPISAPAPIKTAPVNAPDSKRPPTPVNPTNTRTSQTPNVPRHIALSYRPKKPIAILDLPEDFWAVQLVALSSKAALETYAQKNNVRGMSAARIWKGQKPFYVLLLGIYETHSKAVEAVASFSMPIDLPSPWIRSLGSLQSAMLEANRKTGTTNA